MTNFKRKTRLLVPDGNWGWMIVLGVALTNTFNQSLVSVFGLLFSEQLEKLGKGTVGVALVMNLNSVALNLSGLFTGPAIKKLSTRKVILFGSFLTASGLILSSQSTEYWELLVSYGIFVGFGLGLIASATFIAVNSYFNLKRGQAVGFALAGTGFGQMIMPYIISVLLEIYDYRGTVLILGGLALHGFVGGCLCQPVSWHLKKPSYSDERSKLLLEFNEEEDDAKDKIIETKFYTNGVKISNGNKNIISKNGKLHDTANNHQEKKKTFFKEIIIIMDLQLLKDKNYLCIAFGLALAQTASINFSMIFPYFLQNTIKLNRTDTALCMSILASTDLISRLLLPILTDKFRNLTARIIFLIGAIFLIIIRTVLAEITDNNNKTFLLIICGLYGFIRAATVINQSLCISEYCGQDKLPGGLGLNMVIKGIFIITIGQVLGWVRDYTQSYAMCLHAQNFLLLIVVIVWVTDICYKKYRTKHRKYEEFIID